MDDWNKPFTDEELVAIDAACEAAAASSTPPSSLFHFIGPCVCCRFPYVTSSSKPALAPHCSLAEPNCNGQWRCSSRKTFSSRSILAAEHSSKRPFYQEPRSRMALHGRPEKRPLEQHTCSSLVKRPRVVSMPMAVKEAEACMARKWDAMDHDILVTIMKCLVQGSYSVKELFTLYMPFVVCKSWRSAVLDSLFPPGNVLDLRFLEAVVEKKERCYYQFYLKFLLQRPHQYTKLFYPATYIKDGAKTYIAQRLSTLKCLVYLPCGVPYNGLSKMVPYWPELSEAHCHDVLIRSLSMHCKYIRRLELIGRIGNDEACRIAYHFPHLVHLNIQSCILSPKALIIILQGRPHLSYLDTRHAYCINPPKYPNFKNAAVCGSIKGRVTQWDEEDILQKAVGVKTYLHCARKFCSDCASLYAPPNIDLS